MGKQAVTVWYSFGLSILVDVAAAYLIAQFVSDRAGRNETFLAILLLSWAGMLALSIYNTAKSLLFIHLFKNESGAMAVAKGMRDGGLPRPDDFETSIELYLDNVINDDRLDTAVRLKAAAFRGESTGYKAAGGIVKNVAFDAMCEQALKAFKAVH